MRKIMHTIVKIYSITDVTNNLKQYKAWRKASTPIYEVNMLVQINGVYDEVTEIFSKSEWEEATKCGYYLV